MFQVKRFGQQNEKIGNTGSDLRLFFTAKAAAWSYGEFVSCDAINPKPKITFLTSYGQLIHDLSTPQREIERMAGGAEKGFFVVGLATLKPQYQIWIKDVYVKTLDQNHACLLPSEIEIKFGYNDPLIYVSKEIDRNSCKFSQVIRHEQVHQRINILTLEYFLPLIDETIRNAISEVRAIKVSGTSDAEIRAGIDRLYKYYTARLKPIIDEFHKARENEQRKLDNIVNYTMESELCREFDRERPDKRL